jgi:hypothetical protein
MRQQLMRVMRYGKAAPELAATANISAFNVANALSGLIGGAVIDSSFGASAISYAAAIVPSVALLFILSQERRSGADAKGVVVNLRARTNRLPRRIEICEWRQAPPRSCLLNPAQQSPQGSLRFPFCRGGD